MFDPLTELWVIIIFSLLGVLLATRLGLPSVIGVLIFGALIGSHGLGLVTETNIIDALAELGAVLLLFFIGLEFSLEKLLRRGLRALSLFVFKIGLIFLFVYIIALFFNFSIFDSILIAIILSFSSTALFARFVQDMNAKNRREVQVLISVLIMEDIAAVFILAVLSQLKITGDLSMVGVVLPLMISLLAFSFSYLILRAIVKIFMEKFVRDNDPETLLFTALSLCALFASLGSVFGLPASIGAFLAGNIFSSTSILKKSKTTVTNFILVFSSFFFFSIGMLVDVSALVNILPLILLFFLVDILIKFFGISFSSYLFGFDSRGAVFSALMMLSISEFALIIAKEARTLTSFDIITFSCSLLFLTTLASSFVYKKEKTFDDILNAALPDKFKKRFHNLSIYLNSVFQSFEPGGFFFNTASIEFRRISFNIALLIMINAAIFLMATFFTALVKILGLSVFLPFDHILFFLAIALLLSAYPLFVIFRSVGRILSEFPRAFHLAHRNYVDINKRSVFDLFMFFLLFFIAVFVPIFFTAIGLPTFMQAIALAPLLFGILFLLDLGKALGCLITKRYQCDDSE